MAWIKSLFGSDERNVGNIESALDLVIKTAELASNPDDIDQMLDEIRRVTSNLTPGQAMSAEDEKVPLTVYLKLEHYLTTKEPIRTFAKEELRARCNDVLKQKLASLEKVRAAPAVVTNDQ